MLPLYVGALALGGLLIAASIFLGGGEGDHDLDADGDADLDVDLDADADADVDADGGFDEAFDKEIGATGTWLPFLSLRFWTFGLASFGLTGLLLTLMSFSDSLVAPVSTVMGLGIGWLAAWAFRKLKQSNVSGDVSLATARGTEATVLLKVGPGRRGKVRAIIDGRWVDLIAETGDGTLLNRKETVLVVDVQDGVAQVTRLRQLPGSEP